ncbi:hypothetical protein K458DRAFT_395558 [Lentithecium fluviatile CBS 122367]|uniref:Uncharacterized protein n=1 Tax=Lentithecium fluviatile CBS 122367 TaxID=1168545 RepID=A0A6G1IJ42_9PLEO|nr:hypothetical protein K458DRAFT_395558 [Lentithecium fluviatile CBS 122367]
MRRCTALKRARQEFAARYLLFLQLQYHPSSLSPCQRATTWASKNPPPLQRNGSRAATPPGSRLEVMDLTIESDGAAHVAQQALQSVPRRGRAAPAGGPGVAVTTLTLPWGR